MELINIKRDAAVVIFFILSALTSNNIGLKKMPPPIPTTPDINPIEPPIKNEIIFENWNTLLYKYQFLVIGIFNNINNC